MCAGSLFRAGAPAFRRPRKIIARPAAPAAGNPCRRRTPNPAIRFDSGRGGGYNLASESAALALFAPHSLPPVRQPRDSAEDSGLSMLAAVYRGIDDVRPEHVPVPEIGPGEALVRIR